MSPIYAVNVCLCKTYLHILSILVSHKKGNNCTATGIKFCMSSILCRPDSWKTSISPDASMLRKLVRDRNCRPVLRGILESLLQYLTQDLPKLSTRNRSMEKPGSSIVTERNTRNNDCPNEKTQSSMKQTQLQTNGTLVQLSEEGKISQGKIAENSTKITDEEQSDPQKDRLSSKYGGDKTTGDLITRRLTTFQLLQSKFTRSTPKPSISHQREVGTLPSSRGVGGHVNHSQDSERDMPKMHKREQGLKNVANVKDMVAKFAMAEKKEQGLKTVKKRSTKPRLIRRGIFLSSLMERFETMATVCKGSDLKCSHEKSSRGVKVRNNIKEKVECHERGKQQVVDETVHKQNQCMSMKSKSIGQQLKGNQIVIGQEQRSEQIVVILTKVYSNEKGTNKLKAEQKGQTEDQPSDQKADSDSSLKQMMDDNDKGWQLGKYDEIQTTVDETHCVTNRLKYGRPELLCLTSVTEWSFPDPYRLFPQVEAPLSWRMATITTSSPVLYTCVDSSPKQYLQEIKPVTSENMLNMKKDSPHGAPQYSHIKSAADEASTIVRESTLKPKIEEIFEDRAHGPMGYSTIEDPNLLKTITIERRLPKHVIPRVYRFDYQQGADHTDSSSQSTAHPDTITALVAIPPSQSDSSMPALNPVLLRMENILDSDPYPPNGITLDTIINGKPAEAKAQEKDKEAREEKEVAQVDMRDSNMQQTLRLSEHTASKTGLEDSETSAVTLPEIQTEREKPKERPKYTTINYGDPSVKQTYKPKIIRFTDTFTF